MKVLKNALFTVALAFMLVAVTSCVIEVEHTHVFFDWKIVEEPTETQGGKAQRVCECEIMEEADLPALTDTSVWEKTVVVEPTCAVEGTISYSSIYGTVEVKKILPHTYLEWEIVKESTREETGVALSHCVECEHEYFEDMAVLTDESVWSYEVISEATYNESGLGEYTSVYGSIEEVITKLVAPYDGKTYSSFAFDAEDEYDSNKYQNDKIFVETAWNNATITLDEQGKGAGTAYPFRATYQISMVNPKTGEISIDIDGKTYRSFVDMETGIIVMPRNSLFNFLHVLTPFEVNTPSERTIASAWNEAMAITYTFEEATHNIFVYKENVYFGVSFVNSEGASVAADKCYASSYLYVLDSKGQLIQGFGHNGKELQEVDGLEGTYVAGEAELVVTGYGVATSAGLSGTYEVASEGSEYTIGLYIADSYFEVTLDKETMTFTAVKPMVEISFVAGEYATVEAQEYNINIVAKLPVPTNDLHVFKGWFYDEDCTQPVAEGFVPTVSTTLFAKWKAKVVINLVGVLEGDADVLYLGDGDIIGSALPKYSIDEERYIIFRGWYLDENFETSLPEEAKVGESDSNITIYAKWEKLPAYYGTYVGTELWNAGYGNSANKTLTIDADGKMSGLKTGIVVSYNPETQKVEWKSSATSTKIYSFYYDDATGVIAGIYNDYDINNDYYILSKYSKTNKVNANYGVNAPKYPGSTTVGYYGQFVNLNTKLGAKDVFLYNNHIYSNVVFENTLGQALKISEIRNSKTIVVRDATTGEMIFGVASQGSSFGSQSKTNVLDAYFGTYTNGEETVVLDGAGQIIYGSKTGTYTASASEEYGFDVYLENNTEYYRLTLSGETFTMVKPMATISFVVGETNQPIESITCNINVVVTLPNGEQEGFVFNGYFLDQEFTKPVPEEFKVSADTVVYAKHSLPAVVTAVYNNGEENGEFVYSVGDTTDIANPKRAKFKFVGWYTTEDFMEGTEWVSGGVITEDVTIYAKWEVAPIYNALYVPTEIYKKEGECGVSSIYTRNVALVDIDPDGVAPSTSYPFNKETTITDYDPVNHTLVVNIGTSKYRAYIDPVSSIIIMTYSSGLTTEFGEVWFLNPFEKTSIVNKVFSSYWNGGLTRTIEYQLDETTTYTAFVYQNQVFFGVSFKDENGNKVKGNACHNATTLYVYDSADQLIAKFGFNGKTMVALDGFEGTYTNGDDTLKLNGIDGATLNGVTGTYVKASAEASYTFDVYVEGSCYEVTVDKSGMSYTIVKPMVEIQFDCGELAQIDSRVVNKNIVIELPEPTNEGFVFRGWYLESTFETKVSNEYVPAANVTLYAKWDAKVTLTVVYGNGLENAVLLYGVGDTVAPVVPAYTNGLSFNGWYLDAELTQSYSAGTITESFTIYCAWVEAHPLFGAWQISNVYGSSSNGGTSSGGKYLYSLSVSAEGKTSGKINGSINDYDAETTSFMLNSYFGVADVENGVMLYNYNSGGSVVKNDIFLCIRGVKTFVADASCGSYWNSGLTRLISAKVTYNDDTTGVMNIFIHNNRIYGNVTFTSNGEAIAAKDAYKATQLTVKDCHGEVIYTK